MFFTLEHDLLYKNLGKLYAEDELVAYTLDPNKLLPGVYNVILTYSPKFNLYLPHIYNDKFKMSRGFRIHAGNTLNDSNGCILVGDSYTVNLSNMITINNSRKTLNKILNIMDEDNKLLII
jgi:hypothetical protein